MASISASVIIGNHSLSCKNGLEVPDEQLLCLHKIKHWVQSEAEFYGRTDDFFLLMFLRSCKFDIKLTKKTLYHYYEGRRDVPQWWANRNVLDENLHPLIKLKVTRAVIEKDDKHPTVIITIYSRVGENLDNFDDQIKLAGIYMELATRRRSSQKNGFIWVLDCRNYKWWFALRLLNPMIAKNFIGTFYLGLPARLNSIIILNAPTIGSTIIPLFLQFTPQSIKDHVHIFGSDWSKLGKYVPMEIMPEEYGGQGGPLHEHDECFIKEVLEFNDYLLDDNKYGFQKFLNLK